MNDRAELKAAEIVRANYSDKPRLELAIAKALRLASQSPSADVVRMREALEQQIAECAQVQETINANRCTNGDITQWGNERFYQGMKKGAEELRSALDALVPDDGVGEYLARPSCHCYDDRSRELCLDKDRCRPMAQALAQTKGRKSLTSSDGSGSNAARTCDVPAAPHSGDVTQAGHSPLIASDQERNRVRKDAEVGDIVSFNENGVTIGPGEWKTAPELLLDHVAAIRDEYAKLRRDMLDQMEWHAAQGNSEETGRFSVEAERYGMAHLAASRIFKLVNDFRSPTPRRPR